MSPLDHDQVGHIARLAVLAMCARGTAASEFDSETSIRSMVITVERTTDGETLPVSVEFFGTHAIPIAGMSL